MFCALGVIECFPSAPSVNWERLFHFIAAVTTSAVLSPQTRFSPVVPAQLLFATSSADQTARSCNLTGLLKRARACL